MTRAHVQFAIKDERKRGQERRRKWRCIDSSCRCVKSISSGLSWIRVTNLSFLLSLSLCLLSSYFVSIATTCSTCSKLPWNCRKLFRTIPVSGNRSLSRTFPDIPLLLLHNLYVYLQPWTQIRQIDLNWLHSNVLRCIAI